MSHAADIVALVHRLQSYGIEPTHITMGRAFHNALRAELENCRIYLRNDAAPELIATFNGLSVVVTDRAPPDAAWIGVAIE